MHNFEDTKGVIRNRYSKDRPYNGKQKKDNRTILMVDIALHRKLKIEQHELSI